MENKKITVNNNLKSNTLKPSSVQTFTLPPSALKLFLGTMLGSKGMNNAQINRTMETLEEQLNKKNDKIKDLSKNNIEDVSKNNIEDVSKNNIEDASKNEIIDISTNKENDILTDMKEDNIKEDNIKKDNIKENLSKNTTSTSIDTTDSTLNSLLKNKQINNILGSMLSKSS